MLDAFAGRTSERLRRLRRQLAVAAVGWSLLIGGSLAWNLQNEIGQTRELAAREARIHFNKDLAFRRWATLRGGVYVAVGDRTRPSPYLAHIPDRDVTTGNGQHLTLMNPAYLLRQVMDEYAAEYGVRGRITSLAPLNPANAADPWEQKVLQGFDQGQREEVVEVVEEADGPYLRLMRPMITETGCLKCHAGQGYEEGDVRGGIGVSVPMKGYIDLQRHVVATQGATHGVIWLVGMVVLSLGGRRGRQRLAAETADEARLLELSYQNQVILDSVGEGIVGIDGQCRIVFVNPSASRILGWQPEDIIGWKFHDLIVPGGPVTGEACPGDGMICPTLNGGQARQSVGEHLRRKNGPPLAVEVQSAPVRENGKVTGAVLVFHDISERLDHEQRRHDLMERLERSNHDLQDFAYVVSHDLQEPLRMVSSYLALVKRRYDERLDDEGREFIAYAVDGAQRMSRMIADLVDFSRVETRGANFAAVDMDQVVADALANLSLAVEESGAVITVQESLPRVQGDREQLVRLFQNLIGNSLKFRSPDCVARIEVSASVRADGRRDFAVSDNGIGIAPESHQRIFMIFQRLGTVQVDGTGIGLSVVKRIVERHGGEIAVISEVGQGACFRFDLPEG